MSAAAGGDAQGTDTSKETGTAPTPARRLFSDTRRMPKHPPDVVAHLEPTLNTMRRAREHCDVVFRTSDGMESQAHRFVLKSRYPGCGTFFARKTKGPNSLKSKFQSSHSKQGGGKQQRTEWPPVAEVYVSDLSLEMLEIVLDVAYRVPLRERVGPHNVGEVLKVAESLSIAEIRDYCLQVLKENLGVENCVGSYQLAVSGKYSALERTAYRYILRNFDTVWTASPEFQSLTIKHFHGLLSDDELQVRDEIQGTVGAILKWIAGDAQERRTYLSKLLRLARYYSCGSADVGRVIHDPEVRADNDALEFLSLVKAVVSFREAADGRDRLSTFHWLRPRVPKDILFMFGGWTDRATNDLVAYNYRSRRWKILANPRTPRRAHHGVAVLGGLVYFVGGFDGHDYHSSVVCFDVARKKWTDKANMNMARCYVSVAVLDGHIYAMGGFDGSRRTASCERYDSSRNQWDRVASMHEVRSNASAVTAAGRVYVLGGFTGAQVLNSVESYDPVTNAWTQVQGMSTPRRGLKAVVNDDVVYVVGGSDGFESLSWAEQLDVRSGEWSDLADMAFPRCNCAAVVFQGSIYVAGGFDDIDPVSNVERYDIEAGQWHREADLAVPRSAAAAWISHDVPDPKYWLPVPSSDDEEDDGEE